METQTTPPQDRDRTLWAAVSPLLFLTALVYVRVARFDFVLWDDDRIYYANPHIQRLTLENLRWMLTDSTYNALYHPLGWLNYALSFALFGAHPGPNHLVNLAFHLVNTLLVFFLIRRLIPEGHLIGWRRTGAAFVGALFWAIHPLRVEPVSWVAARFHLIAALSIFIALHFYLSAVMRNPEIAWRKPQFWGAFVFYILSVLTFPSGVMFPFALIVMDAYVLQRRRKNSLRELILLTVEKMPYFLLFSLPVMASLWGRYHSKVSHASDALNRFGVVPRLLQACYVWVHFLTALIWPTDLAPMYPRLEQVGALDPFFWGCALLLAALTLGTFLMRKRHSMIWAAWLCHIVFLVPFLGLSQHPHFASDRYSYIASVIWSTLIAGGLVTFWSSARFKLLRTISVLAVALLLVIVGILSFQQTSIWHDSIALFTRTIAVMGNSPDRETLHVRLANTYLEKQNPTEALAESELALAISPNDPQTLLAEAFALYGCADLNASLRTSRLITAADIGDRLCSTSHDPRCFLIAGVAHYQLSHFALAEDRLLQAVALNPKDVQTHLILAEVLYREKKFKPANDELDAIVALDPTVDRNAMLGNWASLPPPPSTLPDR